MVISIFFWLPCRESPLTGEVIEICILPMVNGDPAPPGANGPVVLVLGNAALTGAVSCTVIEAAPSYQMLIGSGLVE